MLCALIYPNSRKVGTSNLGLVRVFSLLNEAGISCSVFFLDERGLIETRDFVRYVERSFKHLKSFDLVLFSISFQNDFINMVKIIKLTGFSKENTIIAGGTAVTINPEPILSFVDAVYLGEAEAGFTEVIKDGLEGLPRRIWMEADVPTVHETDEHSFFQNMCLIEISRGCRWKCRFCPLGYVYLPPRFFPKDSIISAMEKTSKKAVGLISPMVSDHPDIDQILDAALKLGKRVSPSSLRMWDINWRVIEKIVKSGARSLTFAPEAGTERLRRILNKPLGDLEIQEAAVNLRDLKLSKVKLYFMVGLPGEKLEDIDTICHTVISFAEKFKRSVEVVISPFVPKPNTPFQMLEADESVGEKIKRISDGIKIKNIKVSSKSLTSFKTEVILSLGSKSASEFILDAVSFGVRNALRRHWSRFERACFQNEIFHDDFEASMEGKTIPPCPACDFCKVEKLCQPR